MRSEIEQRGYVLVFRPLPDGRVAGVAFNTIDWRKDRKVIAASETEALEALHVLIVPGKGRNIPETPDHATPMPERTELCGPEGRSV